MSRRHDLNLDVEDVTPELANEWLRRPRRDRKQSPQRVVMYAEQMRKGDWALTGDPIRFDTSGRLIDGQHRLAAVVLSKQTVAFVIARGVPENTVDLIDTGRPRRFSDVLQMDGEVSVISLAAAVGNHALISAGKPPVEAGRGYSTRSRVEHLAKHPGLRDATRQARMVRSAVGGREGVLAALIYECTRVDEVDAKDFVTQLVDGTGLESNDPIWHLREFLIKQRGVMRKAPPDYVAAVWIKAWNAYRRGDTIRLLRWRKGGATREDFPTVE